MRSLICEILGNFSAPENVPLHQKCSVFSQPIPRLHAHGGLYAYFLLIPNNVDYMAPANQIFFTFLFLVLYSLSFKSFLPSTPFCSSLKGDCSLLEVLNKIFWYHLNCFLYFLTVFGDEDGI